MKYGLPLWILILMYSTSGSQSIPDYYTRNRFLLTPPAAFEEGLVGFTNPANLALLHKPELRFIWSTDGSEALSIDDWGFFSGIRMLGFGVQRQHFGDLGVTDFRLSTGFGSKRFAWGLAYGWSSGDQNALGREKLISAGTIFRPFRFLSLGLIGNFSLESTAKEGVAEFGVRPLGSPRLTLFADTVLQKDMKLSDAPWSAGAALQVLEGIHLVGRYFNSEAFTLGLAMNFGNNGVSAQGHYDAGSNHAFNTYGLRAGGTKPSVFPTHFNKEKRYVPLALKGRIDYLNYVLFDSKALRLIEILNDIQAASEDPRVAAIVLNLSSMRVLPEHAWEIRAQLQKAQQAGKKVITFIDNAAMTTYHLASVSDYLVMDPQGSIMMIGYALGRTYLKGTLDKLGLGFDEWRFFKYKSAAESLSRDSMSEADRQQLQDYVDDWYELTRSEVCEARKLTPDKFDEIINEEGYFMPDIAIEIGLVDSLARWSAIDGIIKSVTGKKMRGISAKKLLANALPQQSWGAAPKIAVVYGLGICALDEGIKARWLEHVFLGLSRNNTVKAVVFRVDSPGGDGMASDLVAEALRKCSESKPVIVSQGQVAGSGGYWISMYGDTIVAGPNTITGSIGVIGGWLYDKGLSEKLGMTSDLVKRGEHADLGRGVTLPYLGLQIPARNLTPEERSRAENIIKQFYETFVKKVAHGRNMSVDEVKDIAEGHIYSGISGKEIGLVDEIGGLFTAIAIAKQRARLKPDEEVQLIEIPKNKGLFNLKEKLSPINIEIKENPVIQLIKMVSERPGQPLPLMLPGTYPNVQ